MVDVIAGRRDISRGVYIAISMIEDKDTPKFFFYNSYG